MNTIQKSCTLLMAVTFLPWAVSCSHDSKNSKASGEKGFSIDLIPEAPEPQATLYFVGDAMQHLPQINRARLIGNGEYDYSDCFKLIAPSVRSADYAVVNLEVPLGGRDYMGYPLFCAPDAFAESLREAGFDLFLTANNHTLDRLDRGLRRTISILDSLEIDHIGTYYDAAERDKKIPFIKGINGFRIGFLNYTYGTNGLSVTENAEVCYIDTCIIANEIADTRSAGAEIIVVCMHWGEEYMRLPNLNQKKLADFMLSKGADIIIGSHPHVIEPMDFIHYPDDSRNALVVYSLGNFISNQTAVDTRGGAAVGCTIKRDENGNALITDASYEIFFTAKPADSTSNYMVVPASMSSLIPQSQQLEWENFKARTFDLLTRENRNVPAR